jgi:hypothetical protein
MTTRTAMPTLPMPRTTRFTIQHFTTAQLLAHQGDFHFV